MKKFILSSLAAFCMISANAQNELAVVPFHTAVGGSATVEMFLKNNFEAQTLTFSVVMPEGFTMKKNSKGKYAKGASYDYVNEGDIEWTAPVKIQTVEGTKEQFGIAGACAGDWIAPQEGVIMELYYDVAATVEPGVYPIKYTCQLISNEDKSAAIKNVEYTSYVVVGDGKGELELNNVLTATVNEELANETAVSKLNLSGVTAVNGTFTYVDGREVVAPTAAVECDLEYVGDKEGYYSVNVPFAATKTGNLYELSEYAGEYWIFENASSVEADATYLASGAVTLTGHGEIKSVETKTGQAGTYILDGQVWYGEDLTVKPTRGLFIDDAAESGRRIVINGELTGITTTQIEAGETSYDLQGRQVQNAKNGVFVVNGKKQFVK